MTWKSSAPLAAKVSLEDPFFAIIEQAYLVFAYPKPKRIGVCEGCCMDAAIEATFFDPPIGELPLTYIQDWYFAAYEPEGVPKETWAYLLPRILEVLAAGEDTSQVGIEVSLKRFDTGNIGNWSKKEWEILDDFRRMYLDRTIEQNKESLDDAICMFSLAGWPLQSLLDHVASTSDEKLAQCLWRDWCSRRVPGHGGVWITAFWESPDNSTVFDFYTSRNLYDRMEALALAEGPDPELAARASAVADVIEANASWSLVKS
ncbi:MAG: hypothetical protein ABIO86_21355 [Sphingomonas sp.]